MQNNRTFDAIIKQKMEGFSPSVNPSSWEALSQKMDAVDTLETENDTFDTISHEKLHNYEVSYNADHWQIMEAKLEREFYFVQELFRWKTMEIALMFLLLFTFIRFVPNATDSKDKTYHKTAVNNALIVETTSNEIETLISDNKRNNNVGNELVLAENADTHIPTTSQMDIFNDKYLGDRNEQFVIGKTASINRFLPITQELTKTIALLKGTPIEIEMNSLPLFKPSIDLLPFLDIIITPLSYATNLVLPITKPKKQKMALRLGMFGSPNLDRIINPILRIGRKNIPSYTNYALGYSGGVTLGFESGRLEYETGVTYTSKRYKPVPVYFQAGSVGEGFSKEYFVLFETNSLAIPLHIRYNYLMRNKWRLYVYGGASWQVNIQSYYHLASVNPENDRFIGKSNARSKPLQEIEDNLIKGFFDKGSLLENSSLTLDGGLGVERYIRNHWSIFSQVNYSHNLHYQKGFGPFKDKISTFSLRMGVKLRITH